MAKKPVTPTPEAPATAAPAQPLPVQFTLGELNEKRAKLQADIKALAEAFSAETRLKVVDIGLQSALDYQPGPTAESPETVTRVYNVVVFLSHP